MNLTWRNPPAHHWYAAKSPGLSIQCRSSRAHQTAALEAVTCVDFHGYLEKNPIDLIYICGSLYKRNRETPFLKQEVTEDEKWIIYNHVEREKVLKKGECEPPLTIPRGGIHPKKVMPCVWWDWKGVLHSEFCKQQDDKFRKVLIPIQCRFIHWDLGVRDPEGPRRTQISWTKPDFLVINYDPPVPRDQDTVDLLRPGPEMSLNRHCSN
ncbi:HTH_48 domain-containing protein [Trichonephila clavipes]|nr:HTH_48 domain-containing protein [Trichonephila clavipes]